MEDKVELLTYCVIDKNGNNVACNLSSKVFQKWKALYLQDFERYDVSRHYFDPDGSYYKSKTDHQFFYDLAKFMNESESKHENKAQNGRYYYRAEIGKDKGIGVYQDEEFSKVMFYLRSDQLGFSAPTNEQNHPYDLYISKCENKNKAINEVSEWIGKTRTIGGSFLWQKEIYEGSFLTGYNTGRGGANPFDENNHYIGGGYNDYYLEDRVDLALLEIKHYLEDDEIKHKEDNLYKAIDGKKLKVSWLKEHFKDFNSYVEFFMFEDFCEKKDENYTPIDIVTSKLSKDKRIILKDEKRDRKSNTLFSLEGPELKKMFDNLIYMITKRSERIEEVIRNK